MDLYSTNYLTGVVNSLQSPPQFLLNSFFPTIYTETSEEIHFDREKDVMKLAPFVAPVVEGKIMTHEGYTTDTFKPAYIKPKTPVDPQRALKRYIGEKLTGSMSPSERVRRIGLDILSEHLNMIQRRLEWMASSVLRTGQVSISGEKYETRVVNFNRDNTLTVGLSSPNRWNDSGVNPLANLKTWAQRVLQLSGSWPHDIIMDVKAFNLFSENDFVKERLTLYKRAQEMPTLAAAAPLTNGGVFMGTIDGFNIWQYNGQYADDSGVIQQLMPDNTVLMVGQLEGRQHYGAIQDLDAGVQALQYFTKSWATEDPSTRWILTQSAPLLVPYRPNASLCATVA